MADTPQIPAALRALAADAGILLGYLDNAGGHRGADPEVLLAVLNALGVPIEQVGAATRLLKDRRTARLERIVEPVTVLNDVSPGEVLVVLREADKDLDCAIETEDGERIEWRVARDDLGSLSRERVDGRDIYRGTVALRAVLQSGYHSFTVRVRSRRGRAMLIAAPRGAAAGASRRAGAHMGSLRPFSRFTPVEAGDRATWETSTSCLALPPRNRRA